MVPQAKPRSSLEPKVLFPFYFLTLTNISSQKADSASVSSLLTVDLGNKPGSRKQRNYVKSMRLTSDQLVRLAIANGKRAPTLK